MASRKTGLRRGAFTLVELLVVISIIGMLMALLLPAVQQAREAGRRNTCNSNLHNTALAVMNFATSKNQYPGYVEALPLTSGAGGGSSGGADNIYPVSWVVPILPYMERSDIYNLWRNYPNWPQAISGVQGATASVPPPVYMDVLNCPSSPPGQTTANTPCAYVANSGMLDVLATATYPADWQANGVFFNHFNPLSMNQGLAGQQQTVTVVGSGTNLIASQVQPVAGAQMAYISQDYITVHDGSSLTFMLSENNNAPLASLGSGSFPVTALSPQSPGPGYWGTGISPPGGVFGAGTEPQNCFVWWPEAQPPSGMKINAPVTTNNSTGASTETNPNFYMHPSSNHPTGAMVAFCDGHTRFISQDIDYNIFCLLMTPYGQYCNTPGYTPTSGGPPLDSGTAAATLYTLTAPNYKLLRVKPVDESQIQ